MEMRERMEADPSGVLMRLIVYYFYYGVIVTTTWLGLPLNQ